jgi:hypothetical protein
MSGQVDVRFRVLNFPDSGPVVGLVFMHEGKAVAPNGTAFSFGLTPGTTKLEADTLVSLLNRRVVRLVETRAEADEAGEELRRSAAAGA